MKLNELTVKDFYLKPELQPGVLAVLNDLERPEKIKINGKELTVKPISGQWFTFRHRIFLSQPVQPDEILYVTLGVLFMHEFFGKFDDEKLKDFYYICHDAKIIDVWPCIKKFWDEYTELIKREKALEYSPKPDEIAAGISKLKIFCEWGTIDTIAKRLHLRHSDVLDLPYQDCYLMLLKDKLEAEYQERYHQILLKK